MPTLRQIGQHIFPLLRPATPSRPAIHGTAVYCSVAHHKIVATAAHVLDQDDDRTIYLPDGVVLEVDRTSVVSTSVPPGGTRDDDRVDVAV